MKNYTIKTVPNQKIVRIKDKEKCDKQNTYATINIEAINKACRDLDAGTLKLWLYFARNQEGYEFALSSSHCYDEIGMSRKQYDRAMKNLINQGYLVNIKGNNYDFYEVPVVSNGYNEDNKNNSVVSNEYNDVVSNEYNDVVSKGNNALYPTDTRNNTNNTYNKTQDSDCVSLQTTFEVSRRCLSNSEEEGKEPEVEEVKEVKEVQEEIQINGTITKFDLQNVLHYEMIGENIVRFTTGKVFKVV